MTIAAQTLSESVSRALLYAKKEGNIEGFDAVDGTARFCSVMNNAFDILNCRSRYSRGRNLCILLLERNISKLETEAKNIIKYIESLQMCVETKKKQKNKRV